MKKLHIDIETAPNTAHVWGLFKQNVAISQLMESSYVMCYAAKWDGEKKVIYHKHTDKNFLSDLWDLLDEADIVVHYNGTKFDIPTINKELAVAGYMPPSPYKQVDLLRVARQRFKFPSNKLDYVAQQFGLGSKHAHEGHVLWVKCMNGDKQAWDTMKKYNMQDVVLLEKLYARMLPWIDNHPNVALYREDTGRPTCPNCGGVHVHKCGVAATNTQLYQRYRCKDCGTPIRGRSTILPKERRANILTQERQGS